jgi:D-alanine-D-alanine ligase
MGVDMKAVTKNKKDLQERILYIVNTYQQPALVEAFLPGREFTVGILGRPDSKNYSRHPEWYQKDGFHRLPVLELDSSRAVTPNIYSQAAKSKDVGTDGAPGYICPADISPELDKKLKHFALRAHQLLNALDVSRTDVRLDSEGNPRLIEINTLPGLTPNYSDLCIQAAAEGIRYEDLILEILYLGASRWDMVEAREIPAEPARKK